MIIIMCIKTRTNILSEKIVFLSGLRLYQPTVEPCLKYIVKGTLNTLKDGNFCDDMY